MTDTRSMMGQRVVVTGGSGHIGVNLVRSLIADGHRVTVVDVREPATAVRLGATWARVDVRDADRLREVFHGADRARPPWAAPAWAAGACAPVATWVARHTRSPLLPTREALGARAAFPVVDDSKARRAPAHQPRPVQETLTDLHRHFVAAGRVDWSARTPGLVGSRGGPLVASMAE